MFCLQVLSLTGWIYVVSNGTTFIWLQHYLLFLGNQMVSIVISENSLVDMINGGLTLRHYRKKGAHATVHLVSESNIGAFWGNLRDFADPEDKMLVILNLALPSEDALEKIDLEPYECAILYVPSHLIAVTRQIKKLLLKKGIASMPQRAPYKCLPGECTDEVEKRWTKISKILSLDEEHRSISREELDTIGGLLRRANEDASKAVEEIAANNLGFFLEAGKKLHTKVQTRIEKTDANMLLVSDKEADLAWIALDDFFESKKTTVGVSGEIESVVLTTIPTFASEVLEKCDFEVKSQTKLGQGAIFFVEISNLALLGLLIGKLDRRTIPIKFSKPEYVIRKTLMRRLVGGPGPQNRVYRGVKGLNRDMIHKDIIRAPRSAVEAVVDVLKESGSRFEFII
jgi:hypothetical protein